MSKPKKKDDGYPFGTGDWARWSNVKRLKWLTDFRDQLKKDDCRGAKMFNLFDELDQIDKDVADMEKVVEQEQADHRLGLVKTPQEFIAYISMKQQAWVESGSDMTRKPVQTQQEIDHLKKMITDVETADAFIQALDLLQAQLKQEYNATADRLMEMLEKNGPKGVYLSPKDILGKKGN